MSNQYVIGVDVGTGSARAGIFDLDGRLIATRKRDIQMYSNEGASRYEQSSDDIWTAVCSVVKSVLIEAQVSAENVIGMSFDATCSLVVLDSDAQPLAVGEHGINERNIIVWMDQRAVQQAKYINETKHSVLNYVGEMISPEMETPKLLWLKQNLSSSYEKAGYFLDLTDFLTWKATGSFERSICTVVCKWTYMAHESRWDDSYFKTIGLEDLTKHNYQKIGSNIVPPGTPVGQGLSHQAASELGLKIGTPIAAGLIDAHAGAVGSIGALANDGSASNLVTTMSYVFGTSACTLTTSKDATSVQGVWGPYYSAMIPGFWLNEAGQSAAGAAIDQLVSMHPAAPEARQLARDAGESLSAWLSAQVKERINCYSDAITLADRMIVVPEFLGNRAPFADPSARAVIAGLSMDKSVDSLLGLYVAGVCGIAYGLRQILEAQSRAGLKVDKIVISGGAGQDPLIRQLIADATRVTVVGPESSEPVLLGAAMLGAIAAKRFDTLESAMQSMSRFKDTYVPSEETALYHRKIFTSFEKLQAVAKDF